MTILTLLIIVAMGLIVADIITTYYLYRKASYDIDMLTGDIKETLERMHAIRAQMDTQVKLDSDINHKVAELSEMITKLEKKKR